MFRLARFRVKSDHVAAAAVLIERFVAAIEREEPGTSRYESYRVHGDREHLHLMQFRDAAAQDAHRHTPHVQEFVAALYPLCDEPPTFVDLDPIATTTQETRMPTLGKNVKITIPASQRPQARALIEALGLSFADKGDSDVAATATGGHIGFAYVADADALTPAQMRNAPWLELLVPDVDGYAARLDRIGLERLEYADKTHPYFVGPGGVVFRLAGA